MRRATFVLLAVFAGGLAGVATADDLASKDLGKNLGPTVNPNLYPVPPKAKGEEGGIKFSHQLHVEGMGSECSACHGGVPEAETLGAIETPGHDTCADCHDMESEEACATCHVDPENPGGVAEEPEVVKFNHMLHVGQGMDCATCHAGAGQAETLAAIQDPGHDTCNECHMSEMNKLSCNTCHTSLVQLEKSPQDVAVHGAGFFAMHDAWAMGNSAACAQCHEQTYCSDCHTRTMPEPPSTVFPEQVDRQLVHRSDFIGRHALEASAKPGTCQTCHGSSFCQDCHTKELAVESPASAFAASPHPPGYLTRGGEGFHGTDARLSPQQCAACHDQGAASNCVDCHRVGGIGGNPHPPGWDRDEGRTSNPACTPCHAGM